MKRVYIDCGTHKYEIADPMVKQNDFDEYHLFEANPTLVDFDRYSDNPKVTVYNQAVWKEDGSINFFLSKDYTTGSTINENKTTSSVDYSKPVNVPCVNIGKFILDNFEEGDYIKLKMDIEGAEFDVLDSMIADGSVYYLDDALIEFHHTKIKEAGIVERYRKHKEFFVENKIKLTEHY
jgi:FkbM family methyltransferase